MKIEEVLNALKAGEFDGIQHMYKPTKGNGNNEHQKVINVVNGVIELTKITTGKFFNGRENERFKESKLEILRDKKAINFIKKHPYFFEKRRPDLF